jgi:hypothetical protein
MQRTYSRWSTRRQRSLLGLGLAGAATSALAFNLAPGNAASSPFTSRPLDGSRFAVLAKPVGNSDWTLLVLEQIQPSPRCWEARADGLIDPALNRFDFTGICSRYLDSNGYSLRVGEVDLASRYRLRLAQRGKTLDLLAMTPSDTTELLVGRGSVPLRDRDGFVQIQLEPGWELQRRVYGQQTLSHVYFANATPLAQLQGAGGRGDLATAPAQRPLQPLTSPGEARGPIALQVVPFRP